MVVDYRQLNRVTVRKVFLIPDSDQVTATVAGNEFISVGDLKEGFNQFENELETAEKMAVLRHLLAEGSHIRAYERSGGFPRTCFHNLFPPVV